MRFIFLTALVLMLGCDDATGPQACTEEARSSVVLKIQDADTDEILDSATVEFSVDGGESETVTCDSGDSADLVDHCESLALAYEVDGTFEFTVSSPGYEDQDGSITVEKDECHVIGESLTIHMISL